MTLTIDAETEDLVQRVAKAEGKPAETVLREAVVAHALALGLTQARTPEQIRAAFARAQAGLDAMPVLDDRPFDEILGYDERGLPA